MTELLESPVRVNGSLVEVRFDRFDLDAYKLFLKCKKLPESQIAYDWESDTYQVTTPVRFAPLLGAPADTADAGRLPLAEHLFDYQRWIVETALAAERFAIWADTGLGKGPMILEWARQVRHITSGRVLILEKLQVIEQLREEARRFYGDELAIRHLQTREEIATWCKLPGLGIAIANPEKFVDGIIPELRYLAGLGVDESSFLRTGGGVIKWNLIKSARGIRFKLSSTATPAPNEVMEYASQASFLEKLRNEGDILWTYFVKDKRGNWKVRPHARAPFYRFMASWSIYLRDPAHFGFKDILSSLPEPEIREYKVPITDTQRELMYGFLTKAGKGLFSDQGMGVQERSKLSQLAKGFLYEHGEAARRSILVESRKPAFVADLVRADVAAGRQVLVWTVFDAESELIAEHLDGSTFSVGVLDGSLSETARTAVLERFRHGELDVLISKAQLVGYGLNLQFCTSMVFSGFDDSFERMYQAVRRCVRFGQTERVRVHVPYIPELEGMIFANVKEKEACFMADVAECEENYRAALAERVA